jgi:N-acyl-D-aspartate/D-glutamate deacylase
MTDLSLVVRNARIIDGTGRPGFIGDVGVAGDRIVTVGRVARRDVPEIDGTGLTLAPGFIEIHTHYDPHLCWDRLATPSLEHGFTTVVVGNCSLGVAPIRGPEDAARINRLFEKIEDLEPAFFDAAVPYTWRSFPEFLDYIRPGLGINVGALVPHTPLRTFVMGDDANKRVATDEEIDKMCELLGEAIDAGALGISLSYADTDENNVPVPSCWADLRERIALARTVTGKGRRFVQAIRDFSDMEKQHRQMEELGEISLASGALCAVLTVMDSPNVPGLWKKDIALLERLKDKGARVLGQSTPRSFDINFVLAKMFVGVFPLVKWMDIMAMPMPERLKAFADISRRPGLVEEAKRQQKMFEGIWVVNAASDVNKPLENRKVVDIAAERGTDLVDTLLDISVAEGLQTEFAVRGVINGDVDNVSTILDNPMIQIGGSDSGAHVSQFAGTGDSCYLIEHFVRDHKKMSIERAVQRMTSDAASDTGILDRGVIEIGRFADLVLFDAETITRGEEEMVYDLPGGGGRYVRHSKGVHAVVVNGKVVLRDGAYTGERPGRIV